jgi:integrase
MIPMSENEIKVTVSKLADRPRFIMRYIDPVTGKRHSRSTEATTRRDAERAAAKWEAELQEGRYQATSNITWNEFRERYESEKLASLAKPTADSAATAMNHLERLITPRNLTVLTSTILSKFQAKMRLEGMRETTIATHLRHLRAAMSWAVSMEMLFRAPDFHMPKRARGRTLMRGRPITTEEFERMLVAVPKVRPNDAAIWKHYMKGLWLSGLRLEESTVLSWDEDSLIMVDLGGRRPRLRIYAEAEKGHQDRLLPMTPDFAKFLLQTPRAEREGVVFKIVGYYTHEQMTPPRIGRIISEIGRKANVVVRKSEGKFATAHDLRRSFGTRWAPRVKPATLQLLMRHRSIETTLKYYVAQDADEIADELWKDFADDSLEEASEGHDLPPTA